jgi:hypothetical protein
MLVRDYFEIPMPVDAVVARVADASVWRAILSEALEPDDRRLLMRFRADEVFPTGAGPLSIRVAAPRRHPRGTVIDVWWTNGDDHCVAPVMQADLTCSALGPDWTHVEFTGNYEGSDDFSNDPADRMVKQRAGDYAVRLLLTRMAGAIRGSVPPLRAAP